MFQFYGANRTGRWAGRLIQLQNLPQNHMNDLDAARELVRIGDYDSLSMLYDAIPDTLSHHSHVPRSTSFRCPEFRSQRRSTPKVCLLPDKDALCWQDSRAHG